MPMYDYKCGYSHCGIVFEALRKVSESDECPCPECEHPSHKVWVSNPPAAIGDECDFVQENGFSEPRRFVSKIERRRALKEAGLAEFVRHTGVPGSDKSPHTSSWAAIGPETLASAKTLLERVAGGNRSESEIQQEVDDAVARGEATVGVPVGGRTIHIEAKGGVYHGTIPAEALKSALKGSQ